MMPQIIADGVLKSTETHDTIALACSCGECRKTYATEQEGGLWIQAAHDSHHKNRVPDEVILRLARRIWWDRIMGGV